jgi:hypothetical protein|nr:MAG TPA: hypothetical protein [Caudoviricetes sp.]
METTLPDFDQQHRQREIEALKQLDDETLESMKRDALENYTALERLILTISRIQDEREAQELFF